VTNKEAFDRYVVLILGEIYDNFPQPVELNLQKFDDTLDRNTIENFASTIDFLTREGFIRHGDGVDEGFYFSDATLTMKGLTVLNRVPEFFEEKTSWGAKFWQSLKAGQRKQARKRSKLWLLNLSQGSSGVVGINPAIRTSSMP